MMEVIQLKNTDRGKWLFLCAFIFACFLFWWLPSILFRVVVHQADSVKCETIACSIIALLLFAFAYLLPTRTSFGHQLSSPFLIACSNGSYRITVVLFFPAILAALQLWYSRIGLSYSDGDAIPRSYQALLYTHLFFGFMFLGSTRPATHGWRRIAIVSAVVTLPRFIVSLHGGRFFLAQAVVPILLIAYGHGWIQFSLKRAIQFASIGLAIMFVPSITRGDPLLGQNEIVTFFSAGGSLLLFQQNTDLDLDGQCPPLIVSLTAKTIPYGALHECVLDIGGLKGMPATLSRILTINDPLSFNGTASGTGSNYLLDLYLFGGMPALYAGSALFGFTCRRFVCWTGQQSLFAGIWAECLTRALFAPRNDLGYVFERIPSLLVATLIFMLIVRAQRLLAKHNGVLEPAQGRS